MRRNEHFQGLEPDLVNLLTYLHMHPMRPGSNTRISNPAAEDLLKRTLRERRKEERTILN
jgi:hypothetical protein